MSADVSVFFFFFFLSYILLIFTLILILQQIYMALNNIKSLLDYKYSVSHLNKHQSKKMSQCSRLWNQSMFGGVLAQNDLNLTYWFSSRWLLLLEVKADMLDSRRNLFLVYDVFFYYLQQLNSLCLVLRLSYDVD